MTFRPLFAPSPRPHAWGIGLAVARDLGSIYPCPGGFVVEVNGNGRRHRIKIAPIGGVWTKIRDRHVAEAVLSAIRTRVAEGFTIAQAASAFERKPTAENLVSVKLQAFLQRERSRVRSGDISPRTLGELERFCGKDGRTGEFSRWDGWHVHEVKYKSLEQWRDELGARGVSSKTASNILGEFRRFLAWLVVGGDLDQVPVFPEIPYERRAPKILFADEQRTVLAAIPWAQRGIFLAMAHTLRPGEARGVYLSDWLARPRAIHVCRACKGLGASAPVLTAKERNWRVVGVGEELEAWIDWRIERATKAERLRKVGVPLFPNWRARPKLNLDRRWTHASITWEWQKACAAAGVRGVSVYPGTKHTTATDLFRQGVDKDLIQRGLGHKDSRSTDHYVVLADADTLDVFRRRES